MEKGKVRDITVEILISIRDEIGKLREDTNKRFEQMDKRFEQMDKRFEQMDKRLERIEVDIRAIVSHFERDYMLLANKLGELEGRFSAHVGSHP
ncbi:MAG: hypothetical protein AB1480_01905 [Nitrospirota bacterium]